MAELPEPALRDWLLQTFAALVRQRGAAPLLGNPLVLPTPAFFPRTWTPSLAGPTWRLSDLLHRAGLRDFGLDAKPTKDTVVPASAPVENPLVGLVKARGGNASLVVAQGALDRPEHLTEDLARIAGQITWKLGKLKLPGLPDQVAAAVAAWLGFGALGLAASHRVIDGHFEGTPLTAPYPLWAWALALWAEARGGAQAELAAAEPYLAAPQRESLLAAREALAGAEVPRLLGLP